MFTFQFQLTEYLNLKRNTCCRTVTVPQMTRTEPPNTQYVAQQNTERQWGKMLIIFEAQFD